MYSRLAHLLIEAHRIIDEHEPVSERERKLLAAVRFHVAAALLYVRKIHHRWRWW